MAQLADCQDQPAEAERAGTGRRSAGTLRDAGMRPYYDEERDEQLIWDAEYTGPRWRYGLQFRPLGFAQVPDGWILKSERADSRFPTFGTVDYPRALTGRETGGFNLVLIATPEGPVAG